LCSVFSFCDGYASTLPLTCKRAVYLISAAGFLATHVYSPECVADSDGMLSRELYWSSMVTLAPKRSGSGSPSFSQMSFSGGSPLDTPQTVLVRMPSAKPSWKANGSMLGGTARGKIRRNGLRLAQLSEDTWQTRNSHVDAATDDDC